MDLTVGFVLACILVLTVASIIGGNQSDVDENEMEIIK